MTLLPSGVKMHLALGISHGAEGTSCVAGSTPCRMSL